METHGAYGYWPLVAVLLGCFAMHLFGHGHGSKGGHGGHDGEAGHGHPNPGDTGSGPDEGRSPSVLGSSNEPRSTHWRR
jgi:hypothetical protein